MSRAFIAIGSCLICFLHGSVASGQFEVHIVDGSVRIDPVTVAVIESDWIPESIGPGRDYLQSNPVFDSETEMVSLQAARSETVAFQVIVEALDTPVEDLTVDMTRLKGAGELRRGSSIQLYRQWYVFLSRSSALQRDADTESAIDTWFPIEGYTRRLINSFGPGWYPDALIPLQGPLAHRLPGVPLSIPDQRNFIRDQRAQGFWVDIWVPPETAPGRYNGEVVVESSGGSRRIPVQLAVLPITLTDAFHAGIGSISYDFTGVHLANRESSAFHDFFRLAHAHRLTIDALYLNPDWNGGNIDWRRYDELVGPLLDGTAFRESEGYYGPGRGQPVRRFVSPLDWNWPTEPTSPSHDADFVEALGAFDAHVIERGWRSTEWSLFINTTDEPRTVVDFAEIAHYGELLNRATFNPLVDLLFRIDAGPLASIDREIPGWDVERIFSEVGDVVDIWNCCGGVPFVSVSDLANRRRRHPDEQAWFYSSNAAGEPAIGSLLIDGEALGPRTWGWILWRYSFNAGVSWEIGWPDSTCLARPDCSGFGLNGDASLVYLADALGVDGAVLSSIRLKNLRRGAEDYEYLWLLEREGHGDLADAYAERLVPRALDDGLIAGMNGAWVHDPAMWDAVRREMGLILSGDLPLPDPGEVASLAPDVVLVSPMLSRRASAIAGVLLIAALLGLPLFTSRRGVRER